MTRPYSNDLRKRVVRAHLAGEPIRSVAARVSMSSVPKWVALWRETGEPDKVGGHRNWLLEPHRVCGLIDKTPRSIDCGITLRPMDHGVPGHDLAASQSLRAELQTLFALEQTRWQTLKRQLRAYRLVFVDGEADRGRKPRKPPNGIKTKMARYVAGLTRAVVSRGHWRTQTVLATLHSDGAPASSTHRFQAWVQQLLVPMKPGNIVILDNLGSHKVRPDRQAVRAPAQGSGSRPPTRPISTPSNRSSQRSSTGCSARRRAPEETSNHLGQLIDTIQPDECLNDIKNAGYASVLNGDALVIWN